jgi:Domain of unknown function (DUF4388)
MSLLGTLEQFNLTDVLQRLEIHAKSGLLVVKQGEQWVELYFQQGQLLCLGPVRAKTTLEDRLVQAGVISPQARQDALLAIGTAEPGETRLAMMLLDLECVSREALRAWASKETTQVLQLLLTWSTGEIYFEDDVPPPAGRLLVALSIATLLASNPTINRADAKELLKDASQARLPRAPQAPLGVPTPTPVPQPVGSGNPTINRAPTINRGATTLTREEPAAGSVAIVPNTSDAPQTLSASQLLSESIPTPRTTSPLFSDEKLQPSSNVPSSVTESPTISSTLTPPRPIATPDVPRRIDTSFMRPEMVLVPTDLASLRERNPQLQLTPEQWQLFTWADGRTSLQMICNSGRYPANLVCQIVGELIALGLVYLLPPAAPVPMPVAKNAAPTKDLYALHSVPLRGATSGLSNGYMAPVYAAQPGAAFMPASGALPSPAPAPLVAEHGQGRYSQPLPAVQSGGQVAVTGAYAQAGRGR